MKGELTRRQRQAWELLAQGASLLDVAHEMGISRHTVHIYVGELKKKMGVSTSKELIVLWYGGTPYSQRRRAA